MSSDQAQSLPKHFVYLQSVAPTICQDIRYHTNSNFMGRVVKGYHRSVCIVTIEVAQALYHMQKQLRQSNLGLKVFDAYRPQRAVDDFIAWSQDTQDQKMKAEYYPRIDKADFFKLGYIMSRSGHTRGSTVDLTLMDCSSKRELDMGTSFDFMDERSHALSEDVSERQYKNRMLLRHMMMEHGLSRWRRNGGILL